MELSSTHIRCSVGIDLCALERNLGRLKNLLSVSQKYIALVSADAFGFGVEAAAVRLMLSGADGFAVTNLSEGERVRGIGEGWPVIVMSSSLPGEEEFYFRNDLRPTLVSCEETERFMQCARRLKTSLKVHIRVPKNDEYSLPTSQEALKMLDMLIAPDSPLELEALCIAGMGSGAPEEGVTPNFQFLKTVDGILRAKNKKIFVHHSDTFNPATLPAYFESSFRAGLVLFGISPKEGSILGNFRPEPVMTFKGAVSQVKDLPKGATVGYGKTYTLSRDSKIALLSIGYGDGLRRNAGKKGVVLINGRSFPIIGIVSMDQASVDVTDMPDIQVGDEAILIGSSGEESITIEQYCNSLEISPAEALTSITKRVPRYYKTVY